MTRIPLPDWEKQTKDQRLEMSTAEIGLPVRTVNCLEDHGVFTVEELLNCTPEKLLSFPNFGEKTLEEVYRALEAIGLCRKKALSERRWNNLGTVPICVRRKWDCPLGNSLEIELTLAFSPGDQEPNGLPDSCGDPCRRRVYLPPVS